MQRTPVSLTLFFVFAHSVCGKTCCFPEQMVVSFRSTQNYVENGVPYIFKTLSVQHTDYVNGLRSTILDNGSKHLRTVYDYNKNMKYTIEDSTCHKNEEAIPIFKCIPENANYTGVHVLGIGEDSLLTKGFDFVLNNNTHIHISVSSGQCIPVQEIIYGNYGDVQIMTSSEYFNATLGIQDPSVFKIPDSCL